MLKIHFSLQPVQQRKVNIDEIRSLLVQRKSRRNFSLEFNDSQGFLRMKWFLTTTSLPPSMKVTWTWYRESVHGGWLEVQALFYLILFCHYRGEKPLLFHSGKWHRIFEECGKSSRSLKEIRFIKRGKNIGNLKSVKVKLISHHQWNNSKSQNNISRANKIYSKSGNGSQPIWDILHDTQGIT